MPTVDLVDQTFVVAPVEELARLLDDPERLRSWWPDLTLTLTRDRGLKGRQWAVGGALTGTAEVWLEPWGDGVVVHFFLRADPVGPLTPRAAARERRQRQLAWKVVAHLVKDALEAGREPGTPRADSSASLKSGAGPAEDAG